jgi:hypothetical protein
MTVTFCIDRIYKFAIAAMKDIKITVFRDVVPYGLVEVY